MFVFFRATLLFMEVTHAPFDLVFDGLNDTGVFTLTQSLRSFEVLESHLHLLLFERHHGVLWKRSPNEKKKN